MRSRSFPAWGVLVVLTATGCSGGPDKPYPVRGVVVYEDGQPAKELAGGSVTFAPTSSEAVHKISSGTIEEDGTFVLSYKQDGDGAVAGRHTATIEPPGLEGEEDDPRRRRPRLVLQPDTAAQEVTVEPKSNQITLKVRKATSRKGT